MRTAPMRAYGRFRVIFASDWRHTDSDGQAVDEPEGGCCLADTDDAGEAGELARKWVGLAGFYHGPGFVTVIDADSASRVGDLLAVSALAPLALAL